MVNFREVNDDILKEWFDFREETCFCYADKQDRENNIKFDFFRENILKNIPKQNQNYIENQLDLIYDDFMRYLTYITEKYYRNGFVEIIYDPKFFQNFEKTLDFYLFLSNFQDYKINVHLSIF